MLFISLIILKGDIMGNIREEVEQFYLRDHVEEKIETQMVEFLSLSDLVFSRNKRVKVNILKYILH